MIRLGTFEDHEPLRGNKHLHYAKRMIESNSCKFIMNNNAEGRFNFPSNVGILSTLDESDLHTIHERTKQKTYKRDNFL
ncbi:hypothetical protein HanHA300_Chr04g0148541 [Helianthus annuus]|nr:hypothetical protein HanHA300_Chr04g0148541 [Helianthus annuus]KAJ0598090.1 hypothetical protein HanHA89_Chr04g0161931 [Helianthus annuus]KAJ0758725.1 hypothetical protein HanLR1_Chr04g0153561 [Helianthus annuus]KAJ0762381.1 hypothetical protein HanOQP8_Chr04g0160691 [Helianthus annuus]